MRQCVRRRIIGALTLLAAASASAQPSVYEVEPNDTPARAVPFADDAVLIGSMQGADQDGFLWSVSDVAARKRWTFTLDGIPGRLTVMEVYRLEYAENGVDVTGKELLFKMGTRDGAKPVVRADLLFEPGEYLLGLAAAGGSSSYRPPVDSIGFERTAPATDDAPRPGAYRLTIAEGRRLVLEGRPAPRATRNTAATMRMGQESAAYIAEADAWYSVTLSADDTLQRHEISGQVAVGRQLDVRLYGPGGDLLAETRADELGRFQFPDLGLDPGEVAVHTQAPDGGFVRTVTMEPTGRRVEGEETEPNDRWALANRVPFATALSGRLSSTRDEDQFAVRLDEAQADRVFTLRVETAADRKITLGLLDHDGNTLQSRAGTGVVELPDLVLAPGVVGFVVERGAEDTPYELRVEGTGAIEPGFEAEPNDRIEQATTMPSRLRIKGRFSGRDTDFFRFIVADEAQLWRFQLIGDGVERFAYYDGAGVQNQVYQVPKGQSRTRLDNMFLLPGVHYIRVAGAGGGRYTLLARPLGPPDPNGEREPNDDATRKQPLRFGQTRTGLLHDEADVDYYRFHLANRDRIRLSVQPPADGEILLKVLWDGHGLKEYNVPQAGEPIVLEGLFPPGDYQVVMSARQPSDAEYRISLERLARFGCPKDCEPNDNLDLANPLPADLIVEGDTAGWRDEDWYALPILKRATEMTVASEPRHAIRVVTRGYATRSLLDWDREAGLWRGVVPADIQTYLQVRRQQNRHYRLEVRFADGPAPRLPPADPPFDLAVDLETDQVAAYREAGQRVDGSVTIVSRADAEVRLDAATSDLRWRATLSDAPVPLAAGQSRRVPLTVHVPADAYADRPVRVSVRARAGDGAAREGFVELNPGRDAPPHAPVRAWTLPDALLGGFNLAATQLGGRWMGEEDSAVGTGFPYLFDGMAVRNHGLTLRGGTEVRDVDVIVELAGDEALPVAGVAVNLLSARHSIQLLRTLDVALSVDGRDFTPVLDQQLLPVGSEQAFVLEAAVTARFARLRLKDAYDGAPRPMSAIGEFKVIAAPGVDLSNGRGFNLADPALGGHVVWSRPPLSVAGWDTTILSEDADPQRLRVQSGKRQEFAVGFHHDRAAAIARIEWLDEAGDHARFERIAVAVSLESPVGPWMPIGELTVPAPGETAALEPSEPVWARYVRFTDLDGLSGAVTAPRAVRIWERASGGDYRSILTEWGFASQAAIYEASRPLPPEAPFRAADNDRREKAAPLLAGRPATGQVWLGRHEHWYRIDLPGDHNTLTIDLDGEPTVRTVVHLETSTGEPVPLRRMSHASTPFRHTFEAALTSGGSYYLRVEEPPRNVVFTWDTSASVGPYLPVIYSSLMAYAEDLVPGRDAANLIPFGGSMLLRDWFGEPYILQTVINDYPRKESSSQAEWTLARATQALAPRPGSKAIVVVTDAATNFFAAVWDEFERVRPRVFGLGLSSHGAFGRNPPREQDLFQDWSRVNGGHYVHLESEGEMEIAFDRAATLLRRPAGYTLAIRTRHEEAPGPGTLRVRSGAGEPAADGTAIELILDASGSMLKRLGGVRRIEIARTVLTEAVTETIPAGTPVALRVFGHREPNACRSDLEIPLRPLDPAAAAQTIAGIQAQNLAKTPIADSLAQVESDLGRAGGRKLVVLVTDGEETCDGNPEEVIAGLREKGIAVTLNIVGFAIDDSELEAQFEGWAELGGGRYLPARNREDLGQSIDEALRVSYSVYDGTGARVGIGVVDGEPLPLEQGIYRVVVDTHPATVHAPVEVFGGQETRLEQTP